MNVDDQIEKILDLQHIVNELRIDYLCFDYKIITFCMMDPHQVLNIIYNNISSLDDNDSLDQLMIQLKDFINYYEVSYDDIEVVYDTISELFILFGRIIPKSIEEFASTLPV